MYVNSWEKYLDRDTYPVWGDDFARVTFNVHITFYTSFHLKIKRGKIGAKGEAKNGSTGRSKKSFGRLSTSWDRTNS